MRSPEGTRLALDHLDAHNRVERGARDRRRAVNHPRTFRTAGEGHVNRLRHFKLLGLAIRTEQDSDRSVEVRSPA